MGSTSTTPPANNINLPSASANSLLRRSSQSYTPAFIPYVPFTPEPGSDTSNTDMSNNTPGSDGTQSHNPISDANAVIPVGNSSRMSSKKQKHMARVLQRL